MPKVSLNQIKTRINELNPQIIETIKSLVKTPSVSEVDTNEMIVKKLAKISEELGFKHQKISKNNETLGIFIGENFSEKQGHLITSGFSTVNLELDADGKYDPFQPVVEGNRLYGSGAWKNKGNIALNLYLKKILTDLGYGDSVKLLFGPETGSTAYTAIIEALNQGVQAKSHIVSCAVTFNEHNKAWMYTGCRGYFGVAVQIIKKAPDVLPDLWTKKIQKSNPIDVFTEFWLKAKEIYKDDKPDPRYIPGTTNDQQIYAIHAGTGEAIPSVVNFVLNMRSIVGTSHTEYFARIQSLAHEITRDLPYEFKFDITEDTPAGECGVTEMSEIFKGNFEAVTGKEMVYAHSYYNDGIAYTLERGFPVSFFVTLTGKNQNSFNEYLDIPSINEYLEIGLRSILQAEGVEVEG